MLLHSAFNICGGISTPAGETVRFLFSPTQTQLLVGGVCLLMFCHCYTAKVLSIPMNTLAKHSGPQLLSLLKAGENKTQFGNGDKTISK